MDDKAEMEISRALGRVEAQISTLLTTVQAHLVENRASFTAAASRLDALERSQASMQSSIASMQEELLRAEATLSLVEKWRQRGIGAWLLIAAAFSALGVTVATAWDWIISKAPPHP